MRISKLWLLAFNEHGCVPTIKRPGQLAFDVIIAAYERTRLIVITNLLFEEHSGVLGSERLADASRPPNSHPGSGGPKRLGAVTATAVKYSGGSQLVLQGISGLL